MIVAQCSWHSLHRGTLIVPSRLHRTQYLMTVIAIVLPLTSELCAAAELP